MIFRWKNNKYGEIGIDGNGFAKIINKKLPDGYKCDNLAFAADENLLTMFIAISAERKQDRLEQIKTDVEALFAGSGIATKIHWVEGSHVHSRQSPDMLRSPIFYGCCVAAIYVILNIGLKGLAKTVIVGILCYAVSWLFVTEEGKKQINKIVEKIRG